MTTFKVLWLKEHVYNNKRQLDNCICIIYDTIEEKFFYYGTRNSEIQSVYIDYQNEFFYSEIDNFVDFLAFLMDNFNCKITTELHMVNIEENEYSDLDYNTLINKMNRKTILSAYDMITETKTSIKQYLSSVICF